MIGFISEHRAEYGVEPICRVLPIARSTYYERKAIERDPALASDRSKTDAVLHREVQRIWDQNFKVYGVRKVWYQMRREGFDVARCPLPGGTPDAAAGHTGRRSRQGTEDDTS